MDKPTDLDIIIAAIKLYQNNHFNCSPEEHYQRWISQFSECNRDVITKELANILLKSYLTSQVEDMFLEKSLNNEELKERTNNFTNSSLLDIQGDSKSQKAFNEKMRKYFLEKFSIEIPTNDFTKDNLFYFDDYLFTGSRLRTDVKNNLINLRNKKIEFMYIGIHSYGEYTVRKYLNSENLTYDIWRFRNCENRKYFKEKSDIFWPIGSDKNKSLISMWSNLNPDIPIEWRKPNISCGELKLFTSLDNREIIENEFLYAGITISNRCSNSSFKPLGFAPSYIPLGFGGTLISSRRCPNNAPLCLWWGNQEEWPCSTWYPLFQRN